MTWIDDPEFAADRPFGPQTLPYGVVTGPGVGDRPVLAVRVGDHALPLRPLAGELGERLADLVSADSLNPLLAAGRPAWDELRERLVALVTADTAPRGAQLLPLTGESAVQPVLPFTVADYVDFYSSRHHAENVGRIFRPDSAPLLPNWTHLPVGYHGRAGTVVVSGTDVVRPSGQSRPAGADAPVFGPSRRLDIEAEVGFVVGTPSPLGTPVSVDDFGESVFGVVLVNDWSARDIQAWEYVPLGPFLGKSFATSVSPWVVPLLALEAARVATPPQDPEPLPYLREKNPWGLDLSLEIRWNGQVVSRPPYREMYWSPAQMLAHMTVNGASARTGDLFASGTVSGPDRDQRGAFIELTWGGKEPVTVNGEPRTFLEDGDEVTISATAPGASGARIGFGEVRGRVLPAR